MKNIEIKAHCKNAKELKELILASGGLFEEEMHQVDTYFNVQQGRLKLREINDQESVLIYYERENSLTSKESNYQIYKTTDPKALKEMLAKSVGVKVVVDKTRELFIYGHTRIHVDRVKDLGDFMELETVITTQTMEEANGEHQWLIGILGIKSDDLITHSYSDMLLEKR
jgi:adenylate cyclase, class 2